LPYYQEVRHFDGQPMQLISADILQVLYGFRVDREFRVIGQLYREDMLKNGEDKLLSGL
jgi:hypothetical protein